MGDRIVVLFLFCLLAGCQSNGYQQNDSFQTLFNGKDLNGWINVNQAPQTWLVKKDNLVCEGKITSYLSSENKYDTFTLEFDFLNQSADSAAFLIIHNDLLPETGSPFPEGSRIILHDGEDWTHYIIQYQPAGISISINGQPFQNITSTFVTGEKYISFASPKAGFQIKEIKIAVRESESGKRKDKEGSLFFYPLYNNNDLGQWALKSGHIGHWTAQDWVINYDGKSAETDKCLWSKKTYRDFILIADVRLTRQPEPALSPVILPNGENGLNPDGSVKEVEVPYAGDTGIYLRGDSKSQVNIGNRYIGSGEIYGYRVDKNLPPEVRAGVTPDKKADNPPGEWNRFVITLKGDRITVVLNNETVINNAQLPGIPAEGAIALQDDHADNNLFQFANIYIREL
ncbi:MAG: DUF1080 domain-containing protein [Chitinophagaceae bacterium]|nr:DUF1080 domain-containing protein [Chitinophagaceae bacterium]